ncbi:MAG: Gfo/Idh/MocA family oxidoreductase [Chloroflexota bacterium]|nr:MAG: Gfo/Idh/MocA family oxidoreductase [Chloroflexota bacterium]
MTYRPVKTGIVGCGTISVIYLKVSKRFPILDIVALADMFPERAAARAAEYGIARSCTVDELLADPAIELVINLTIPNAHAGVARAAIAADKSVYTEKPLAVERADGAAILREARAKGLRVGNAPDTFLGAGIQTCREVIDSGAIGDPVAATAFFAGHGPESWHPDPAFYYHVGGGPMFDMGPYYLTALVSLIGPIRRVTGSARVSFPTRTITSKPKYGEVVNVEIPTHIAGVLDFANGAVGTIVTSFDVWGHHLPRIEIHGTEGSLSVPDPNTFGGEVLLRRAGEKDWTEIPVTRPNADNSRSLGVADMAMALRSGRPHRANGDLAYHVLDVMHAIHEASRDNRHVMIESTVERPAPLPVGLAEGELDA